MLIVVSGLPASGKSTLAGVAARRLGGAHLRLDVIENALRAAGVSGPVDQGAGYATAWAIAEDLARQGLTVFGESVNGLAITRAGWRQAADRAGVPFREVEIGCSDPAEHEHRARTRGTDITGHALPTWHQILDREYDAWPEQPTRLDTAGRSVEDCVTQLCRIASGETPFA